HGLPVLTCLSLGRSSSGRRRARRLPQAREVIVLQQEHDLDSTFAVHSDVVLESIEDMMIAVHLGTARIVELNETASRLLELLMGGATAATAAGMIADEYSAPAGEVLRNVEGTVEALLPEGIIQRGPN